METTELRQGIKEWLDRPLKLSLWDIGMEESDDESRSSQILKGGYAYALPDDCQHVTRRDVLAIALFHLERLAGWAELVEARPGEREFAQDLFGEDPADVASYCDTQAIRYHKFKAFCAALEALAGNEPLPPAARVRHLKALHAGPALLRQDASSACTFDKPRKELAFEQKVLVDALRGLAHWLEPLLASHAQDLGRGRP